MTIQTNMKQLPEKLKPYFQTASISNLITSPYVKFQGHNVLVWSVHKLIWTWEAFPASWQKSQSPS